MSFIDRLFPAAELEALGNKWPMPVNKKRKLDSEHEQKQARKQIHTSSLDHRRHTVSLPSKQSSTTSSMKSVANTIKRSNSASQPSNVTKPAAPKTTSRSCLPNFIEPSLLKNYLHHLHPSDRSRYSIPESLEPEVKPASTKPSRSIMAQIESDESACSPASMTTDNSSSSAASEPESCPTPSAGMFEQYRTGPFGHLFNGMRITEHERDFMEDLLGPMHLPIFAPQPETKAASSIQQALFVRQPEIVSTDNYGIDESALQQIFGEDEKPVTYRGFSISEYKTEDDEDEDDDDNADIHSSGMSPINDLDDDDNSEDAGLETSAYPSRGLVVSVDDFFNLEEASELA